ncbi:MAG: S41 family peptidase [Gemmatimonadota bacterium]|jgi:carboxyl-terminal processing protease|nr:S41 family peptidase [Gemmatimonadota bacterium]
MKLKRTVLGPILVVLFAIVSGGWLLQQGVENRQSTADERVLNEILSRIARDYVDRYDSEELYEKAIQGFLKELGDPHTNFLSAAEYNDLRVSTTGEYGGLGIQIAERDGWITILAPMPGTPAERAGLLSGDRIVEVEGQSTEGWSDSNAVDVLRGPIGTNVNIKIARAGVAEPIPFQLTREEIHVNAVRTSYLVEPTIGYSRLDVFSETATSELRSAITRMKSEGMKSMILDLRSNPGGLLDQGVSVSELFLNRGMPIVETRARNPRDSYTFRASGTEQFPGMPIVVLVNEYSASAAEIVAGALQDHDRALVIGTTSFGKGSVQTLFPLSGGNYLKMTTGRWYTPVGRSIQKSADQERQAAEVAAGTSADSVQREAYRTDSGRVVYGGGGIVPDLTIQADTLTAVEREFFVAASRAGSRYTDAVYQFAVQYAKAHPELSINFPVTGEMDQGLFNALRAANVDVTWEQFQGARRIVDREVALEIARARWGQEGMMQRSNLDDNAVSTAVDLLRQAPDQQALFTAAQQRSASR